MKTCSYVIALLLAFCTVFQWSCRSEHELIKSSNSLPITVDEAKSWFERKPDGKARSAADEPQDRLVYWAEAQTITLSNGTPTISVPLYYDYVPQLVIPQDTKFESKSNGNPKLSLDKSNYKINNRLLISKDNQGNYRTCVISILPTKDSRAKNKRTTTDTFEGTIMVYDESETYFMFAMQYDKGKLKKIIKNDIKKGARLMNQCYQAIYQHVSQRPAQVGGSSSSSLVNRADQLNIPVYFQETENGSGLSGYILTDIIEVNCQNNTPTSAPIRRPFNPDFPEMADWVMYGGGGPGGPGVDPNAPVPIDEGEPIGLDYADRFVWEMRNRIGTKIYFTSEETELIRDYPNLMTSLRSHIQEYNSKPNGSTAFKLNSQDRQMYPRFAAIVDGMLTFVQQHERVKQALMNHTNLSWERIQGLLRIGSGPQISIYDISAQLGHPVFAKTSYPGFPYSTIAIQDSWVRGLEMANLKKTQEATAFLLTITLLHEVTHYGAVDAGRNEIARVDEFGDDFEREVLKTLITRENAGQLRIEFYKNN